MFSWLRCHRSINSVAMILASAGMLDKRRAITHHSALADLEAGGAIVVDERFEGKEAAARIAADLEYPRERSAC